MVAYSFSLFLIVLLADNTLAVTSCKTCQSPPSDAILLCRCDDQCRVYGDCCPDVSVYEDPPVISDSITAVLSYMECQSRYRSLLPLSVGDAYYMVSSCPPTHSNWTQDEQYAKSIANNCSSLEFIEFPPVSDPSSGITYRNEFCAICHSVETSALLTWSSRLVCDEAIQTQNVTLDLIHQYCSRCLFDPPITSVVMDTLRWCVPVESTCPTFTDQCNIYNKTDYERIVQSCISGDYNPIHSSNNHPYPIIYKNSDCAKCSQPQSDPLQCIYPNSDIIQDHDTRCNTMAGGTLHKADTSTFSAVLTVSNNNGTVAVNITIQGAEIEVIRCRENQAFDPVQGCRDIVCPKGLTPITGSCKALERSMSNETVLLYVNCTPTGLDQEEYVFIDNSSIRYQEQTLTVVGYDANGDPLVCSYDLNGSNESDTNTAGLFFTKGYFEVLYIGSALSFTASVMVLVTYVAFSELRTLPSRLLLNLVVSFLISDPVIIIIPLVAIHFPEYVSLCVFVGILSHFFLLTRFSWMVCLGAEYCRIYLQIFRLTKPLSKERSKASQRRCLFGYMVAGWGIPLMITLITIVVNFTADDLVRYGTDENGDIGPLCWINDEYGLTVAYTIPVMISCALNFAMFSIVLVLMCVVSQNSIKELQRKRRIAQIRLVLGIFSVLGLTWVFGVVALFAQKPWSWFPYLVSHFLQAILIAVTFLTTRNIIRKYVMLFKCKPIKNFVNSASIWSKVKSRNVTVELVQMPSLRNVTA